MNSPSPRIRSAAQWWLALLALTALLWVPMPAVLPLVLQHSLAGLLFFVAGLFSVFFSRKHFNTFKVILIEFSVAVPQRLPKLWDTYFKVRRSALLTALLPALAALIGRLLGLEQTPIFLLGMTSLMLLWLYRSPRQLPF